MDKKNQLIAALKKERIFFEERGQSTKDHDLTIMFLEGTLIERLKSEREKLERGGFSGSDYDSVIKFLETGIKPNDPQFIYGGYELLNSAIVDFDDLCADYLT